MEQITFENIANQVDKRYELLKNIVGKELKEVMEKHENEIKNLMYEGAEVGYEVGNQENEWNSFKRGKSAGKEEALKLVQGVLGK